MRHEAKLRTWALWCQADRGRCRPPVLGYKGLAGLGPQV